MHTLNDGATVTTDPMPGEIRAIEKEGKSGRTPIPIDRR